MTEQSTPAWEVVKLKDLSERITKGSTPTSYGYPYTTEGIRFIKAENIDSDGIASSTTNYIDFETHQFLKRSILKHNDILFSIAGTIGRVGLLRSADLPANTNQALAIIRLRQGVVDHKYLFHFLRSPAIQKTALKQIVGVGRANLSLENIGEFEIPVAPLDQQKRIVAEIEKQFSRLDEAVANLKRVKANLKRYKAAVLKAAVEGRLVETEAKLARREGRSYETGAQLLQRILETRRSQWQGKGKYKEPIALDSNDLPELPEGWAWATVDLVCDQIVDCPHSTARFKPEGFPCIDTTWMTTDGLVIERARYVDQATYRERIARLEPKPGDIVFAREGTIGTAALIPERMKPCLGQRVMLLRSSAYFLSGLLRHALHSEIVKSQYRAQALGSTVPHINVGDVKLFRIPVPPLTEQHRIVDEVDLRLSLVRETEAQVDTNLQRAVRLQQCILSKGFSEGFGHMADSAFKVVQVKQ